MTSSPLSEAALGIVDWLGELGARWGLPADACRVHGLLYLLARAVPSGSIGTALSLSEPRIEAALMWLAADGLASESEHGWLTDTDPWALMQRALQARRARELAPARDALRRWQAEPAHDPLVDRQARRLFELVENVAAIDAGARRLSPDTMRRLVGAGGRAARLMERAFNRSGR